MWGWRLRGALRARPNSLGFDPGWWRAIEGWFLGAWHDPACLWLRVDGGLDQEGGDGGGEKGSECYLGRWSRRDVVTD